MIFEPWAVVVFVALIGAVMIAGAIFINRR
jgi:hypothetical protein